MKKIIFTKFDETTYKTCVLEIDNAIYITSTVSDSDITIQVMVDEFPEAEKINKARNAGYLIDTLICDSLKIVTVRNLIKTQVNFSC